MIAIVLKIGKHTQSEAYATILDSQLIFVSPYMVLSVASPYYVCIANSFNHYAEFLI